MKVTRIMAVGVAAAAVIGFSAPLMASADGPTSPEATLSSSLPLRALAAPTGIRIGTAVNTTALAADPTYEQITAREFSAVTPENVMKWQLVEPVQGQYDWTAADQLVSFARAHGQLVRGHTLVWHNQLPSWLTGGSFTPEQLKALLKKHILDEVGHFRGKIWQWDVVNEAFNDDGTMRNTIWLQALGPEYIADAFRWAHQADPRALLFYNDYNIEGVNAKSNAVYAMVQQLRNEGVPINGVGAQGHYGVQYGYPGDVLDNLTRFGRLGLYTALTEVDVRMVLPSDNVKVQSQAEGYSSLLRACLLARRCLSYTVWGFADQYSWVPGVFTGQGSADLYDANYQPKPAYQALRQDLAMAEESRR